MYGNPFENQPRFTISYHKSKTCLYEHLNAVFESFRASVALRHAALPLADCCAGMPDSWPSSCIPAGIAEAGSQRAILHLRGPNCCTPALRPRVVPLLLLCRPHSLFRRLVSLLLAVLVLTTSVGLTVQRQTCRMSGHSTVAVSVAGRAEPARLHRRAGPGRAHSQRRLLRFQQAPAQAEQPGPRAGGQSAGAAPALLALLPTAAWLAAPAGVRCRWPRQPRAGLRPIPRPRRWAGAGCWPSPARW